MTYMRKESVENTDINKLLSFSDKLNYLNKYWKSSSDIPEDVLQKLKLNRTYQGGTIFIGSHLQKEEVGKIAGALKNCSGYLFAHHREYLKCLLKGTASYDNHLIARIFARIKKLRNDGIPPIFQENLEGQLNNKYEQSKMFGVEIHAFPTVDFIINEFGDAFKPATDLGSANTPCLTDDVIYFTKYAFRGSHLDETIFREIAYVLKSKKRFNFKSDESRDYVLTKTMSTLEFLQKSLKFLAEKHGNSIWRRKYSGENLEDVVSKKFWYVQFDDESKQRIVDSYANNMHKLLQYGHLSKIAEEAPSVGKMRYLFPCIESIFKELKEEKYSATRRKYLLKIESTVNSSLKKLFETSKYCLELPTKEFQQIMQERKRRLRQMSAAEITDFYKTGSISVKRTLISGKGKGCAEIHELVRKAFQSVIGDSTAFKTKASYKKRGDLLNHIAFETGLSTYLIGQYC